MANMMIYYLYLKFVVDLLLIPNFYSPAIMLIGVNKVLKLYAYYCAIKCYTLTRFSCLEVIMKVKKSQGSTDFMLSVNEDTALQYGDSSSSCSTSCPYLH